MHLLSVLLLVSQTSNVQLGIEKAIPDVRVATSMHQVVKAIETKDNKDQPDLEVLHFLGRARAYGFHEINFVIRAGSKEHAHSILQDIVSRLNSSQDVQLRHREGMGLFNFAIINDEATNVEIHQFIEYSSGKPGALLFVDGSVLAT